MDAIVTLFAGLLAAGFVGMFLTGVLKGNNYGIGHVRKNRRR